MISKTFLSLGGPRYFFRSLENGTQVRAAFPPVTGIRHWRGRLALNNRRNRYRRLSLEPIFWDVEQKSRSSYGSRVAASWPDSE
jgi:hypothetical protein